MLGNMMKRQLNTSDILKYAEDIHGDRAVVSAIGNNELHRTTYSEISSRCRKLANALIAQGVKTGDRVATLAWNGFRHLELYYAISGIGAVCHTINPRLSQEQIIYIIRHAHDQLIFIDVDLIPLVESVEAELANDIIYVILAKADEIPLNKLSNAICYEALLHSHDDNHIWQEHNEDLACGLCYTSGTTGNPKGVLYSHRSTVLQAFSVILAFPSVFQPGVKILPVVPLFHVNAWSIPYTATLSGAEIVFPGRFLDGKSLYELMQKNHVVSAWGVPTIWLNLLEEISKRGAIPDGFRHVVIGGSAAPSQMIESFESLGIDVAHSWGMTEMSPIGSHGQLFSPQSDLPIEKKTKLKTTQGRRLFGVDMKLIDSDGNQVAHDGKSVGELYVRGNTVVARYFNETASPVTKLDNDGWFGTGDVAKIDRKGFLTITDRSKDLIKSGGEWISSIELENIAMAHGGILSCAAIGAYHPKWGERPLLIVVTHDGRALDTNNILDLIKKKVPNWQVPDDVVFIPSLPLTATGKVSKLQLRLEYKNYFYPAGGS